MSRFQHFSAFGLLFVCALLLLPAFGQTAPETPAAPVPPQIGSAKRVFVSNAGAESNIQNVNGYKGGPNRAYDQFYAAMKGWGHYELVSVPADADLVLEIMQRDSTRPALPEPRLTLRIIDPKTQVNLWAISTYVEPAGRTKNREKNYDAAMTELVNDLRNLVSPAPPTTRQ